VYLPAGAASSFLVALQEADAPLLDDDVRETARIEAGRPRFGVDMDAETIPLEAGIEHRAISLTKGCYVGQEVIIRVLHRGQGRVARRLCWLVSEAEAGRSTRAQSTDQALPWRAGALLRAGGKDVGRLTSVCASPTRKRLLAIGLVHRDAAVAGTSVEVVDGGASGSARVEMLPHGPVAEP
jgi:folate-binding protein YgfZ